MKHQAPRGTEDVLPAQAHRWRFVERAFAETVALYGYGEIRTPTFEDYELFARSSGDTSDIVSKEMYDFVDKGGRHVALRPEGTAPVMRAYIEHSLGEGGLPVRLWYCAPMFRYGRPQKGRLREHHQVGLEIVGSDSPLAEVEVASIIQRFYGRLGIHGLVFRLNNIGRADDRARYGAELLAYLSSWLSELDAEARARAQKNPLRLFDSKDPAVHEALQGAPSLAGFLSPESAAHFEAVCEGMVEAGLEFTVDPSAVRGLDYYTDTVFEVQSSALGAQSALCGGGRYDGLVGALGGKDVPSVGCGIGIERALLALEAAGTEVPEDRLDVYLVAAEGAEEHVRGRARWLRENGVSCLHELAPRTMKAQFKSADRSRARFAAVYGPDEIAAGTVTLKDLATGEQRTLPDAVLLDEVRR